MARTALALSVIWWGLFHVPPSVAAPEPKFPGGANLQLDDVPQPLVPKRRRSEAEQDRVLAAGQYVSGRIQFQREEYDQALRSYQRAYRLDPTAVSILNEIVPLAFQLNHHAEAARYAVITAEQSLADPVLLRRLALYLTERRDFQRALQLYDMVLQEGKDQPPDSETVLVHVETARLAYLQEQFDKAAGAFDLVRRALEDPEEFGLNDELRPIVEKSYPLMAEAYLEAGRGDDAAAMFAKVDEAKTNNGVLAYQLARVDARQGRPQQALEKLQEYFDTKQYVRGQEPYGLLQKLLRELEHDEANATRELIARLEKLREHDPDNSFLALFLAEQYLATEEWEKAESIYEQSLVSPTLDQLTGFRGLIKVLRRAEKIGPLLDILGQLVSTSSDLRILGDQAKAIIEDEGLLQELMKEARQRRQENPDEFGDGVPLALGLLALTAKQFEPAEQMLEWALTDESVEKPEVLLAWGLGMLAAEQNERAIRTFRRAIDEKVLPDDNPAFYYYLAGALALDDKSDEAVRAARKAVEILPDSPRFASRVPWVLYHANRYDEATSEYRQLIEKFDKIHTSEDLRDILRNAKFILSNICVIQKQFLQAEEWLEQVLDEFPEDVGALNDLGYLYADQDKRLQRALHMATRAVEAKPDNIAYLDSMGWVLFRLARLEEAKEYLVKAAAVDQPDGVILDHLGDVYIELNETDKAIESWQRAVKAFAESENQDEMEKTAAKLQKHAP